MLAVFLAYQPAWQGGFLWDDNLHLVDNPVLKPGGLAKIWTPGGYVSYWPLTFTAYWLQFMLWGLSPLGYHLVNIALHAVAVLLVWRLLLRLHVPGAMLAAAIFALHPVSVETVAWISQLKGILALLLGLVSMLCFLAHERLPALGFVNIYFMRYSLVADHYQYAAMIVPCAALAAAMRLGIRDWGEWAAGGGRCELPIPNPQSLFSSPSSPFPLLALVLLATLAILTWRQSRIYADAETLYRATIDRNPACWSAHGSLGDILVQRGLVDEAITHYRKSLETNPDDAECLSSLAKALTSEGQTAEAIDCYQAALRLEPDHASLHNTLGLLLAQRGEVAAGIEQIRQALQLQPDRPEGLRNLAWILATCPNTHFRQGGEAVRLAQRACELSQGKSPDFLRTLADAYLENKEPAKAAQQLRAIVQLLPGDADVRVRLAKLLAALGNMAEAGQQFGEAIRLRPDRPQAYSDWAWILATHPQAGHRNAAEAIRLAERACKLSAGEDAVCLDVLAAAYAEAGRFAEAVKTARQALDLARRQGKPVLAQSILPRIWLYEAGKPFRDEGRGGRD